MRIEVLTSNEVPGLSNMEGWRFYRKEAQECYLVFEKCPFKGNSDISPKEFLAYLNNLRVRESNALERKSLLSVVEIVVNKFLHIGLPVKAMLVVAEAKDATSYEKAKKLAEFFKTEQGKEY